MLILAGAALGITPEGIHGVFAVLGLTCGKGLLVQNIDRYGVVRLVLKHRPERAVDNADHGLIVPIVGLFQNQLSHSLVRFHTLLIGIVSGTGGIGIAEGEIAHSAAHAKHQQQAQGSDLLLAEAEVGIVIVGQLGTGGYRHQHLEEQGNDHRLNGEEEQILENAGNRHDTHDGILGLVGVALICILPCEDQLLQHHIHKEANKEPGNDHTGGAGLGTVQTQCIDHSAGDLRQHKGQEILAGGEDHKADGIGNNGRRNGYHGSKDHSAQRSRQGRGLDGHLGSDVNCKGLQGNTKSNHQCGDHQHFDILQLCRGITPVGLGKGMRIKRGTFDF